MSEMKEEYEFRGGKRGPVEPAIQGKTRVTIRLDDDVLDWFRARVHEVGGGNYQTLINRALREHMHSGKLEEMMRRVLREELHELADLLASPSRVQSETA